MDRKKKRKYTKHCKMSRRVTRSKSTKVTMASKVSYREDCNSSSDEADGHGPDPGPGLFGLIGLLMGMQRQAAQKKKSKKRTPKRQPKRKSTGCDCPHCNLFQSPRKRCTTTTKQAKAKRPQFSTPAASTSINLESDDEEVAGTNISDTQVDTIKNKVDSFFKALGSSDDELEMKQNINKPSQIKPEERKSKAFYTVLSDSEEEKPFTSVNANANKSSSFSEPSTSGLNSSSFNSKSSTLTNEKKTEDLFDLVDNILNDCDIVDITEQAKKAVPVESLEDLKKKTEEIIGSVTSLIEGYKPKEEEKKAPDSPQKEAPACPICLETLGGHRQAMVTFCGHMFCEPCISQVAKTTKKCPTCRKQVTAKKFHPVYM